MGELSGLSGAAWGYRGGIRDGHAGPTWYNVPDSIAGIDVS